VHRIAAIRRRDASAVHRHEKSSFMSKDHPSIQVRQIAP
jgi:hypothetical protein